MESELGVWLWARVGRVVCTGGMTDTKVLQNIVELLVLALYILSISVCTKNIRQFPSFNFDFCGLLDICGSPGIE